MSPENATEFLHRSRPFLGKKLEAGEMPLPRVDSHRRILISDLIEDKRKHRQRRLKTFQQMRQEAEDLGLYE